MESIALHFSVTGEAVTNIAREKLFVNKDLEGAIRLLRSALCTDQLDSDEQLMLCLQVLHGAAWVKGVSDSEDYGVAYRDDIEERPTELSSIAQLIKDLAEKNEKLEKENHDLCVKFSFLASNVGEWTLSSINNDYYNEYGEPMFPDIEVPSWAKVENQLGGTSNMLDDFLKQREREAAMDEDEEPVCDYGWLEPDGTWHPVPWGEHSKWAGEWLQEHYPFRDNQELYWKTMSDGSKRYINNGDVLIYSLGWILMDSPYQGTAKPTRDEARKMTKAQKEFLYDYYIERNRHEEANRLYSEDD